MKKANLEALMKRVAAGVLLALFGVSGSALAVTPDCGDVIGPGATVNFDSDLDCDGFDPALTFIGPNTNVRMNGFTLTCIDQPDIGILLDGRRVQLHDGSVVSCGNDDNTGNGAGIVAAGDGKHRIDHMRVEGSEDEGILLTSGANIVINSESHGNVDEGLEVDSDLNDLSKNDIHDNGGDGIEIDGNRNKLTKNDASHNSNDGIDVEGSQNTIVNNTATFNGNEGIEVDDGDGNSINSNTATNNAETGIEVQDEATNTVIKSNTSTDNNTDDEVDAFDMQDDTADCGTNLWRFNTFDTADVDGGGNPGLPRCIE